MLEPGAVEDAAGVLELARALCDLGAAPRRRAAAREPLGEAAALAERCGAGPLARRVRDELPATGGRARRERLSEPDALTRPERRVAELAAARGYHPRDRPGRCS